MTRLARSGPAVALVTALAFGAGCASMSYTPRSSPFLKVVQVDGGQRYRVADRDYHAGLFGGLAEAVAEVPEAREHAEAAVSDAVTGLILVLVGSVLVGLGTSVTLASAAGGDVFGEGDGVVGTLFLVGGLGMTFGSMSALSSMTARQVDAINTFNDVMWERHQRTAPVPCAPPLCPGDDLDADR